MHHFHRCQEDANVMCIRKEKQINNHYLSWLRNVQSFTTSEGSLWLLPTMYPNASCISGTWSLRSLDLLSFPNSRVKTGPTTEQILTVLFKYLKFMSTYSWNVNYRKTSWKGKMRPVWKLHFKRLSCYCKVQWFISQNLSSPHNPHLLLLTQALHEIRNFTFGRRRLPGTPSNSYHQITSKACRQSLLFCCSPYAYSSLALEASPALTSKQRLSMRKQRISFDDNILDVLSVDSVSPKDEALKSS